MNSAKYALVSVFDKTGIVDFAKILLKNGYQIISTGGTAKVLTDNDIPVIPIQQITGNPESFDGRMKTISFQIESGILYDRKNPSHVRQAKDLKIKPIDIVVCNLYPFEKVTGSVILSGVEGSQKKVKLADAIENIDVGGPTMVRSAAKNFENVVVIVNPTDYEMITQLLNDKKLTHEIRKQLAAKAFYHLSFYDSQIAHFFSGEQFPSEITIAGRKTYTLRYGENPHQQGAVYVKPNANSPFASLQKKFGRELSHTNIGDITAGLEVVRLFDEPAAVVIKHNTPCGIALGSTPQEALKRAIAADPTSAFGGTIVTNNPMDKKTAAVITSFKDAQRGNIDVVAVPAIDEATLANLQKVRKTMGIYTFGKVPVRNSSDIHIRWIEGGFVLQNMDINIEESFANWKVVTKKKPTKKQLSQMQIGWLFVSRVRSNSILIMDKTLPMTRGIGSGQTSRIRSAEIALSQAGKLCKGAVLVSDSFFPFDDSVKLAVKKGIGAIVQQGGSVRDQDSIDAANKAGIAMVFTGRRAFWH